MMRKTIGYYREYEDGTDKIVHDFMDASVYNETFPNLEKIKNRYMVHDNIKIKYLPIKNAIRKMKLNKIKSSIK